MVYAVSVLQGMNMGGPIGSAVSDATGFVLEFWRCSGGTTM